MTSRVVSLPVRFALNGAALVLLALAAGALAGADYPRHLAQQRLTIVGPGGNTSSIDVRIADSPTSRARGMQHLEPATIRSNPMWFVFPQDQRTRWHMRNVAIPLVIAYVAADGRVVAVERMQPGESGYGIEERIRYALEVAASQAEALGLEAGARLRLANGEPPR